MNMTLLSDFDPRPATLQWMDEKEHRTRNTPKAAEQEWFNTVFTTKKLKIKSRRRKYSKNFR